MAASVQPTYPPETHALWGRLLLRQQALIRDLACPAFQVGLDALALTPEAIPRFEALSARLQPLSGWTVHAVDGLLPADDFFARLADRRFPVTWWLRRPDQADYIVEPDLFHDLVGHLPLLAHPAVGQFIQAYGAAVTEVAQAGEAAAVLALTRLYWFTIEFGLVGPVDRARIYGAGLLSSFTESQWCLHAPEVARVPADLATMLRQDYVIDTPQPLYFVLPDLDALWAWSPQDLVKAARHAATLPALPIPPLRAA
jgi:phenylalanine-4-hydroxylase